MEEQIEVESEVELTNVNIEAEANEVKMQLSSDKMPTFEKFTTINEGIAVTDILIDKETSESLQSIDDL